MESRLRGCPYRSRLLREGSNPRHQLGRHLRLLLFQRPFRQMALYLPFRAQKGISIVGTTIPLKVQTQSGR